MEMLLHGAQWVTSQPPSVSQSSQCVFTCKDSQYSPFGTGSSGRCLPGPGHYKDADGSIQACGQAPAGAQWGEKQSPSQEGICVFTCTDPHKVPAGSGSSGSCEDEAVASTGEYVDRNGQLQSCGQTPVGAQWVARQTAEVKSADECLFTCTDRHRRPKGSGSSGSCELVAGYYVSSGNTVESCGQAPAGGSWSIQPSSVQRAGQCIFTCVGDSDKSGTGSSGSCVPHRGYFMAETGVVDSCGSPPAGARWKLNQPSSVQSANDCVFKCGGGRNLVASGTSSGGSCLPAQGFYLESPGVPGACGNLPTPGAEWVQTQSTSVQSTNDCAWECGANLGKKTDPDPWENANNFSPSCVPLRGYYLYVSTGVGVVESCGDAPVNARWKLNQDISVQSANNCVFTCLIKGTTPSGTGPGSWCNGSRGFFLPPGRNRTAPCGTSADLNSRGARYWAPSQPTTVTLPEECEVRSCRDGSEVLNTAKTACVPLPSDHYKDPNSHEAVPNGYYKNQAGYNVPDGHYRDPGSGDNIPYRQYRDSSTGTATSCGDAVALAARDGTDWADDQTGVTSQTDCKLAGCSDSSTVLSLSKLHCNISCSSKTVPPEATGWADDQSEVTTLADCKYKGCNNSYKVLSEDEKSCGVRSDYYYKDITTHKAMDCRKSGKLYVKEWYKYQNGVFRAADCRIFSCVSGKTLSKYKTSCK